MLSPSPKITITCPRFPGLRLNIHLSFLIACKGVIQTDHYFSSYPCCAHGSIAAVLIYFRGITSRANLIPCTLSPFGRALGFFNHDPWKGSGCSQMDSCDHDKTPLFTLKSSEFGIWSAISSITCRELCPNHFLNGQEHLNGHARQSDCRIGDRI